MKSHVLLLLWLLPGVLPAQSSGTLSLSEVLELAVNNSGALEKARIDRQAIEARLREGRADFLPQVGVQVNLDAIPQLPTQLLPGNVIGQPEGTFVPVRFGQPWQMGGLLKIDQLLYTGAMRIGPAAASASRTLADLASERAEQEVIYQTAGLYYQVLQSEQLLRALDANLAKLKKIQEIVENQYKNDYAVPTDVRRVRVTRANVESQRRTLTAGIDALRQSLLLLCGLDNNTPLVLQPAELNPAADSARLLALQPSAETSVEYRLLQQSATLNRIQRRVQQADAWPTLRAYASAGFQTFADDPNFFADDNRGYGILAFGLRADWKLFDGMKRKNRVQLTDLDNRKIAQDLRQLPDAKNVEFRQARQQLLAALENLRYQSDNVELARDLAGLQQLQYAQGTTALSDLLNSQTTLAEAETQYWQQVYTYKIAVLKLLKASGKLNELTKGKN